MKRLILVVLLIAALGAPVHAQLVVVDHGNLKQTVMIAERTLREYETLIAQYETLVRMAQGLGGLERYRLPPIAINGHDPSRWAYGSPWLQGLNSGDARGTLYRQTTRSLDRPGLLLSQLPAPARRAVENAYATIEITDAVAQIAGHQVALVRGYGGSMQQAIQALENDVVNPRSSYHEMTAVLDKVAAAQLLARRQDVAANQLLSHALEQLLARGKRIRDTEAAAMNMRLGGLLNGRAAGASLVRGASSDLRTWRQP
jgi:conjugal transfer/entry exclusion protein